MLLHLPPKSSKGLQVVLKGIEPDVKPEDIAEALKEKAFCAKSVHNIKNRNRQPQPLIKIELESENKHLKKTRFIQFINSSSFCTVGLQ